MSASGQKPTFRDVRVPSALPSIADARGINWERLTSNLARQARDDWSSHGADAFRIMATRFRAYEPPPPPKPKHDRVVLMADAYGRVHYEDDGGRVEPMDVIWRHCKKRERERRDGGLSD